jgi:DNA-binding transcriptional LysR family regulator
VRWERLFSQPFLLAVPPGHPLAGRPVVSLAEASQDDFVMLRSSWDLRRVVDELCRSAGFRPRVAFEGDDLVVVRGLVASGLGVAVVPSADEEPEDGGRDDVRLVRLEDDGAYRDVGIAWPRNRRMLPSAELFRRHVLGHA